MVEMPQFSTFTFAGPPHWWLKAARSLAEPSFLFLGGGKWILLFSDVPERIHLLDGLVLVDLDPL